MGRNHFSARRPIFCSDVKSKNSAYCRVHQFKVLHFQRFFSLARIIGPYFLYDVKHAILVLQKQFISTKHSLRSRCYKGGGGPLSAYKSEATMFGLTEIQARLFVCFHRVISQNFFTFSLTFLITFLTNYC